MRRCTRAGCGWGAIAPSGAAATEQYVRHLVEDHASVVDVGIPEGMVQVRVGENDEWVTMTPDEARELHATLHGARDDE